MCRSARVKVKFGIYHIMIRSITEVFLFRDDCDKDTYLEILKRYKSMYGFKIYAYCLMNNHAHFMIYSNGADISKIMHGINLSYVKYYNEKYKRRGPLFQDRFNSKIVTNDSYAKVLSLYIHNNPKDIPGYSSCVDRYKYSSINCYINNENDTGNYGLVDNEFILQMFSLSIKLAKKIYMRFMEKFVQENINEEVEFTNDKSEYKSYRTIVEKCKNHSDVLNEISKVMKIGIECISFRYNRRFTNFRCVYAFSLRFFCGYSCKEICSIIGGITQAYVSKMCLIGQQYVDNNIFVKERIMKELCGA